MRLGHFLFIASVAFSPLASALTVPVPSAYDKRVQSVIYNPDDVFEINTKVGISTQVLFAEDESIVNEKAVSGFVDGWSLVPQGNSLFVKAIAMKGVDGEGNDVDVEPVPGTWNTNILVTTNKRVYVLDLKLHGGSQKVAYLVKFKYPQDEYLREQAAKAERERQVSMEKTPVVKNKNYTMRIGRRSKAIAPSSVFDDGTFTYFTFPGNREIPAIFHVSGKKDESIVNSHIDPKMPGTVVVHRIGEKFILRYGKSAIKVFNESYDDVGELITSGTTVDGVERQLKGQ